MSAQRGRAPRLNVTPFIDVLLVLLIIFMVVTSSPPRSLVAGGTDGPGGGRTEPAVRVAVSTDGFSLDGHPVTLGRLEIELRSLVDAGRGTVVVEAADDAGYEQVVHALSAAELAGAARVGLRGAQATGSGGADYE
jgi:biopolymer transport protein ExbD